MPTRCLRLFDSITPRTLVFIRQERFFHVGIVTSLTRKVQNSSNTGRVLRKTNLKSGELSPEPRVPRHVDRPKQLTSQDLLERIGVSVKKIDARVDLKKLPVVKVKNTLHFLEEIGIERQDKGKIIARRPGILTAKEYLLRQRVQTMRNVGINPDSIAYVVKESPGVLTGKTEESLPEKVSQCWHT